MGSRPSQPWAAARIWSKMRPRAGVRSAISITVPGWPSLPEVDETPARAVPLLAHRVAGGEGSPVDRVVILGPAQPVLQPLASRGEELSVHAGRVRALLDQLELD